MLSGEMMKEISVAIVEDHSDLRAGLELTLESESGIQCSGSYDRCETLIHDIAGGKQEPQVIMMDIGLPGISGIEGVRRIKAIHPDVEILMLTIYEDDAHVFQAICAGAAGYLLKNSDQSEILAAIRQVAGGGIPMTPAIARRVMVMFRDFAPAPPRTEVHLTPREKEVLTSLVNGLNYKEIASEYFISLDTVRNHIRHIYQKLGVHSKSEAVAKALRQRLI